MSQNISTPPPSADNQRQLPRLLVVDSDTMMCELLHFKFEDDGFLCDVLHTLEDALKCDLTGYSIIIVDLMDRNPGGKDLIRSVRSNQATFNIPIVILSEKATEDDIVEGLGCGADDFISKPFSSRILIARVRSIIRRRQMMIARRAVSELRFHDLVLNLGAGTASIAGEQLSLSRTEFMILAMFLRNRNTYYSRADIQREVWEDDNASGRAVDTSISRLRKKIGDYGNNIVNRQGFGYAFRE